MEVQHPLIELFRLPKRIGVHDWNFSNTPEIGQRQLASRYRDMGRSMFAEHIQRDGSARYPLMEDFDAPAAKK